MASNNLVENNLDDVEEGEILDDDEPIFISEHKIPSNQSNCRNYRSSASSNYKHFGNSELYSRRIISDYTPRKSIQNESRPVSSVCKKAPSIIENNKVASARTLRARRRRQRQKELRKRGGVSAVSSIRPFNYSIKTQRHNNQRNKTRENTPYEERLKEFKLRQQRIKSRSKSHERKPSKNIKSGVIEQSTGSSLLKRLVGSGSAGIKKIEENVAPDVLKVPHENKYSKESEEKDISSKEKLHCLQEHPTECIPLPQDPPNLNPQVSNILEPDQVKGSNFTPENRSNSPIDIPPVDNVICMSAEITTKQSESILDKYIEKKNENVDSGEELDNELIKLRMEALKTAVLKKHNERLKRGYVPKKTNEKYDLIVDSFLEEVESIEALGTVEVSSDQIHDAKSECSDMSLDSNYVSDNGEDFDSTNIASLGLKRCHVDDNDNTKRIKLDIESQDSNSLDTDNVISDLNDEELHLRALALKSFLQRKALKDSDNESDKNSLKEFKLEELSEGSQMESIIEVNQEEAVQMKCEIDSGVKEELNTIKEEEIQVLRKRRDTEDWEELDEDILRAQLLKTLSANLPVRTKSESSIDECESADQSTSKNPSSLSKSDLKLELQSRIWSEKMVPKLVISLGSDSESEAEPTPPVDFVKSLDLLLKKAKEKSEKKPSEIEPKTKIKKKNASLKQPVKKLLLDKGTTSTPTAVKHLPIQQQEEYRRLKIKLAEKMKSNLSSKSIQSNKSTDSISNSSIVSTVQSKKISDASKNISAITPTSIALKSNATLSSSSTILNTKDVDSSKVKSIGQKLETDSKESIKKIETLDVKKPVQTKLEEKKLNVTINELKNLNTSKDISASAKKNVLSNPAKALGKSIDNRNPISMKLKPQVTLRNTNKIINRFNPLTSKTPSLVLRKDISINKTAVPTSLNNSSIISRRAETIGLIPTSVALKKINITNKSAAKVPILPKKLSTVSNMDLKKDSDMNKKLVNKTIKITTKDSENVTQQSLGESSNLSEVLKNVIKARDTEGNSDKENDVIKSKSLNRNENTQETSERSGNKAEQNISVQFQEAQSRYDETLSLVMRLEKELEEAKKMLTTRGKILLDLKEKIVKDSKKLTPLVIKLTEDRVTEEKSEGGKLEEKSGPLSHEKNECWDPDGVLCPYQLAGSCKDPLCTYHHIPSS